MKKYLLISFILLLVVIPLVLSAPPVTTIQQFSNGFVIKVPQNNILKINQDYDFEFHVYNISNGVPIISGISCFFHLYNQTGNHLFNLTINTISDTGFDYGVTVKGGNFSTVGMYYYNIQCNNTVLGGYSSQALEITNTGFEVSTSQSLTMFLLIGILLTIGILLFIFGIKMENISIKLASLSLTLILLVFLIGYILNISNIAIGEFSSLTSGFNTVYLLFIALLTVWGIGIVLYLVYFAFTAFSKTRGLAE